MKKKLCFGELLKKLMFLSNTKVPTISSLTQYEPSTIYKWLSGERLPSSNFIDEILSSLTTYFLKQDPATLDKIAFFLEEHYPQKLNKSLDLDIFMSILTESYLASKDLTNYKTFKNSYPDFLVKCNGVFKVASYPKLVDTYIYYLDNLPLENISSEPILILTSIQDNYLSFKNILLKLFKKIKLLTSLGYNFDFVFMIDKYKQNSLAHINVLIEILFITGINHVNFKLSFTALENRYIDKAFVIPKKVAILTYNASTIMPTHGLVIEDHEILSNIFLFFNNKKQFSANVFKIFTENSLVFNLNTNIAHTYCFFSTEFNYNFFSIEFTIEKFASKDNGRASNILKNYLPFWKKYASNLVDSFYIIDLKAFNRFVFDGFIVVGTEEVFCSVDKRILCLRDILHSMQNNPKYNLILIDVSQYSNLAHIEQMIIHSETQACLKIIAPLKSIANPWLAITDEFIVDGLYKLFFNICNQAKIEKTNEKNNIISLLLDSIAWLENHKNP